jgi:hypothetical protein
LAYVREVVSSSTSTMRTPCSASPSAFFVVAGWSSRVGGVARRPLCPLTVRKRRVGPLPSVGCVTPGCMLRASGHCSLLPSAASVLILGNGAPMGVARSCSTCAIVWSWWGELQGSVGSGPGGGVSQLPQDLSQWRLPRVAVDSSFKCMRKRMQSLAF